ncbi:MAG: hypothetical protein IJ588_11485 [Prevotella sp.]|nr:hypothetical protein [Prevotella sp.]
MALSEQQIQQLNAQCNKLPIAKLVDYIDKGFVRFPDDLSALSEDRKNAIAAILNSRPNPQEQAEWRAVESAAANLSGLELDELRSRLSTVKAYQDKWGASRPVGNHVDDAPALIERIKEQIKIKIGDIEESDWQAVDQDSVESLIKHKEKYPDTCHLEEIDRRVWTLLKQIFDTVEAADKYLVYFPDGLCAAEAREAKACYDEWDAVKQQYDLIATSEFIKSHPLSPFGDEAEELFRMLKADEVQGMVELQGNYPIENLLYYLDNGIFTEEELIEQKVATKESIQILKNLERIKNDLPDVNAEIAKCRKVCADKHTDVFLFGIPSTGKTCILMGLIGCTGIDVDTVRAGGPYSSALDQYLKAGLTIGQTPKDFVATIEAEITEGNKKHLLNLVEMSGEDFAFKIADNENGKISFEDMGNGATRLLCNNNRKVFFIIVDPTARVVAFNHLVESEEGSYLIRKNVNQRVILKRMVDLLKQPENKDILKKVEAINIIVTKSDTLGSEEERDQKALQHFRDNYENIIAPLTALCREFDINRDNGGRPKLYTFSLGQFYVGGIYKYSDRDAMKLVQVLRSNTETFSSGGFGDKLKKVFN